MLDMVAVFALAMSGLNWLLFLALTWMVDMPALRRRARSGPGEALQPHGVTDGEQLLEGTGKLAGAFRQAGSSATVAAMSLMCLVVSLVAAGLDKV
jgi:hypothetical protein